MRKLFIVLIASVTFVISCRKPETPAPAEPQLPPITQSGKNTFGCLIDGKVWLPKGGGMLWPIETEYSNGYLLIIANQSNTTGLQSLGISVSPVHSDTLVHISNNSSSGLFQFFRFADAIMASSSNNYYYPIGSPYTGELNITKLDAANHIMAGTFWFDAIDTVNNKTIQIREGRFDVKY